MNLTGSSPRLRPIWQAGNECLLLRTPTTFTGSCQDRAIFGFTALPSYEFEALSGSVHHWTEDINLELDGSARSRHRVMPHAPPDIERVRHHMLGIATCPRTY